MDRRVIAGMLGLSLAGCSSWSTSSTLRNINPIDIPLNGTSPPGTAEPVPRGQSPLPSIHDTINGGGVGTPPPGAAPGGEASAAAEPKPGPVGLSPLPTIEESINAAPAPFGPALAQRRPAPYAGRTSGSPRLQTMPVITDNPERAQAEMGAVAEPRPLSVSEPSSPNEAKAGSVTPMTPNRGLADETPATQTSGTPPAQTTSAVVAPESVTDAIIAPPTTGVVPPEAAKAGAGPAPEAPAPTAEDVAITPPMEVPTDANLAATPATKPDTPVIVDPEVNRTSIEDQAAPKNAEDQAALKNAEDQAALKIPKEATNPTPRVVARVGDAYISLDELNRAVRDFKRERIPEGQALSFDDRNQIAKLSLGKLIERTLLVEEARRGMKKPKQWEALEKYADEKWRSNELPPLLKKYSVANEHELKQKLEEKGDSLDRIREVYRLDTIGTEYLMLQLAPKLKPTYLEMEQYYHEHIKAFELPAEVRWREIVIAPDEKTGDRAAARRKAEALLARLRRGEDFAKLAKRESQGPTAEKEGLWEHFAPGSHRSPEINRALDTQPVGQISPILEAPDGFHIVRVEGRRAAGPAKLADVQPKISVLVFEEKRDAEYDAYMKKLYDRAPIWTAFDGTASAPALPNRGVNAKP